MDNPKSENRNSGSTRKQPKKRQSIKSQRHKKSNREGYLEWKKNRLKYQCLKLLKKERKQNDIERMPTVAMEREDSDFDGETRIQKQRKEKKHKHHEQVESYPKKSHMFSKAQHSFHEKKKIQEKETQEHEQEMNERSKALKKYRNSKKKRQMILNKKTNKGQPIMKYQMNLLLEKIKSQAENS